MRNSPLHRQRHDTARRDAQLRTKAETPSVPTWVYGLGLLAAAILATLM